MRKYFGLKLIIGKSGIDIFSYILKDNKYVFNTKLERLRYPREYYFKNELKI